MMSAKEYYVEVVGPAVDIFREKEAAMAAINDEASRRQALAAGLGAAVAVANMVDYRLKEMHTAGVATFAEPRDLRNHLSPACPVINVVNDVADAHKHCELRDKARYVWSATMIVPAGPEWDKIRWDEFRWDDQQICVAKADGSEIRPLRVVIDEAYSYWQTDLGLEP